MCVQNIVVTIVKIQKHKKCTNDYFISLLLKIEIIIYYVNHYMFSKLHDENQRV